MLVSLSVTWPSLEATLWDMYVVYVALINSLHVMVFCCFLSLFVSLSLFLSLPLPPSLHPSLPPSPLLPSLPSLSPYNYFSYQDYKPTFTLSTMQGQGGPDCDFYPMAALGGHITLESCMNQGSHIGVLPSGQVTAPAQTTKQTDAAHFKIKYIVSISFI